MRSKEEAHDYRYFAGRPASASREQRSHRRARRLPSCPTLKHKRFVAQYGIPAYDATY
jgi:aspartyl-tRNA(Asn)/glutamyl-tRNA(Gln) amidotransferase subunit B